MTKSGTVLVLLGNHGLIHSTGTNAAGADIEGAHRTISKLMANALQIGVKTALGLDVGVADIIAALGRFAAESAYLAHDILRIYRKTLFFHVHCGQDVGVRA